MAETTLKLQLVDAHDQHHNSEDFRLTKDLLKVAKRVCFTNETRTIRFVLPDNKVADHWHRNSILFQKQRLQFLSLAALATEDNRENAFTPLAINDAIRYAVRVITRMATAIDVQHVLAASLGPELLSNVWKKTKDTSAYDSNFFVVVFRREM